jgi:NAD(P)-dependent dehydrogenase (short-subunit alcohol dehydrogenase family)
MESPFAGKTVLVTGADGDLGHALVEEALRRRATRVYAGTRQRFSHLDERVTPLLLAVTDETQIQRTVGQVGSLDVLINNAGVQIYAVQAGEDDIFPDPMSATPAESRRTGAVKQMERQHATLVAAGPIAA